MQKIVIAASIYASNVVSAESIKAMLANLGEVEHLSCDEVEVVDTIAMSLPEEKSVWVYCPPDDSVPYLKLVGDKGIREGQAISDHNCEQLAVHGVCSEFFAEYPRASRYGYPLFASQTWFAEALVGSFGFRVPASGLRIQSEDRRDDGAEEYWFKISLPSDFEWLQ